MKTKIEAERTCSNEIELSFNSTFCLPSSSSSSSSSNIDLLPPFRIPPNAALLPANENGVDATDVPNTLMLDGAPNAANSVTTLRGGEPVAVLGLLDGESDLKVGERGGVAGAKEV